MKKCVVSLFQVASVDPAVFNENQTQETINLVELRLCYAEEAGAEGMNSKAAASRNSFLVSRVIFSLDFYISDNNVTFCLFIRVFLLY